MVFFYDRFFLRPMQDSCGKKFISFSLGVTPKGVCVLHQRGSVQSIIGDVTPNISDVSKFDFIPKNL